VPVITNGFRRLCCIQLSAAILRKNPSSTTMMTHRTTHCWLAVLTAGAFLTLSARAAYYEQQAYIKASNTGITDFFGDKVSVSGDVMVVGAWMEDSNATGVNGNQSDNSYSSAGAAYVFVRSGKNWVQQAYLKASNPDASDRFGIAVGVSGDTIVIAARDEDSSAGH
jgi:hypothetical protein